MDEQRQKRAVQWGRQALVLIGFALCCAAIGWSKTHIAESEAERVYAPPVVIPPPVVARAVALGYYAFAADVYWLRLLEYFGDKRYRLDKFNALVPLTELVTDLDPSLCFVYRQAGLILTSTEITDLEAANRLLWRGVERCPDDTYIPFVLGFNLYYFQHRFKEAGEMLQKAAQRPNAPDWLADLAVRVQAQEGDLDALETMLTVMSEGETDDQARASTERRLRYVRTEKVLRQIDAALAKAPTATSVADLVRLGLLPRNLHDPSGGELSVVDGRGKSSAFPKRLELSKESLE